MMRVLVLLALLLAPIAAHADGWVHCTGNGPVDTAAIQAALASVNSTTGGFVHVSSGTMPSPTVCPVMASINLPPNVVFFGDGAAYTIVADPSIGHGATKIVPTANGSPVTVLQLPATFDPINAPYNMIQVGATATGFGGIAGGNDVIRDMTLDCNGPAYGLVPNQPGISQHHGDGVYVGVGSTGASLGGSTIAVTATIDNVNAHDCGGNAFDSFSTLSGFINSSATHNWHDDLYGQGSPTTPGGWIAYNNYFGRPSLAAPEGGIANAGWDTHECDWVAGHCESINNTVYGDTFYQHRPLGDTTVVSPDLSMGDVHIISDLLSNCGGILLLDKPSFFTGMTWAGGVVTATTQQPVNMLPNHVFVAGDTITVGGVRDATGGRGGTSVYNGTFVLTSVTNNTNSSTLTWALAGTGLPAVIQQGQIVPPVGTVLTVSFGLIYTLAGASVNNSPQTYTYTVQASDLAALYPYDSIMKNWAAIMNGAGGVQITTSSPAYQLVATPENNVAHEDAGINFYMSGGEYACDMSGFTATASFSGSPAQYEPQMNTETGNALLSAGGQACELVSSPGMLWIIDEYCLDAKHYGLDAGNNLGFMYVVGETLVGGQGGGIRVTATASASTMEVMGNTINVKTDNAAALNFQIVNTGGGQVMIGGNAGVGNGAAVFPPIGPTVRIGANSP